MVIRLLACAMLVASQHDHAYGKYHAMPPQETPPSVIRVVKGHEKFREGYDTSSVTMRGESGGVGAGAVITIFSALLMSGCRLQLAAHSEYRSTSTDFVIFYHHPPP